VSLYEKIRERLGFADPYQGETIQDSVDFAAEHGFRIAEINLNRSRLFPENFSSQDRDSIGDYAKSNGVSLSFHGPVDVSLMPRHKVIREASILRFKEMIDFASDLGGRTLTVHPGRVAFFHAAENKVYFLKRHYPKTYFEALKNSLRELSSFAQGRIGLCIENTYHLDEAVKEVIEAVLSESELYLTWDVAHAAIGDERAQKATFSFFESHLEKIKVVHLHDRQGGASHLVIGTGEIDFSPVFRLLADSEAYFIIEMRNRAQTILSLRNLEGYLKRL
jgi:sugar phosphate isomerase/epimerase